MEYYLVGVLVSRTPRFRTYFQEGIVSKHIDTMDVMWRNRLDIVRDECILVNGVPVHPLFVIADAQGQPLFAFSHRRFDNCKRWE